ncbi:MAG: hypothetical protein R3F61_38155 [Myxococcota bacterium]
MILSLLAAAFADGPTAQATYDSEIVDGRRNVDTAFHVGLDMRGIDPGFGARLDLGHRVSVEGVVMAGLPTADRVKWTGGASLGLELAPLHVQIGTHGALDFRVGVGGTLTGNATAKANGGGFDLAEWAAGTLHISPNGTWSFYGGVLASDVVSGDPVQVMPRTGVRFRLD